eukprot:scaffold39948_cov75-Phaeocystis_antarctica.AAC.3
MSVHVRPRMSLRSPSTRSAGLMFTSGMPFFSSSARNFSWFTRLWKTVDGSLYKALPASEAERSPMSSKLMTPGLMSSQRSVTVMPLSFSQSCHQRVKVFSCCWACFSRRANPASRFTLEG